MNFLVFSLFKLYWLYFQIKIFVITYIFVDVKDIHLKFIITSGDGA